MTVSAILGQGWHTGKTFRSRIRLSLPFNLALVEKPYFTFLCCLLLSGPVHMYLVHLLFPHTAHFLAATLSLLISPSSSSAVIFLMPESTTLILVPSVKEAVDCSSYLVPDSFCSSAVAVDHVLLLSRSVSGQLISIYVPESVGCVHSSRGVCCQFLACA